MAMSRFLFFFIFSLSALFGSTNGRPACGSTPTTPDWRKQMEQAEESQRQNGRIGLECEPEGYSTGGSGSVSAAAILLELLVLLFIIFGVAIGIWFVCVRRQKAINAANLSGQVVGAQVAHGTDLKSYPETKTVQKGDS